MKLPNQVKPVKREITSESRGPHTPGARPADFLDDLLRGVQVGSQIAGTIGQTALPFLSLL
jgi:hypothetical protein